MQPTLCRTHTNIGTQIDKIYDSTLAKNSVSNEEVTAIYVYL